MPNELFKPWGDCVKDGVATLDCVPIIFSNLFIALSLFVGIALLITFLFWAFKFMNSAGDAKKIEGARVTFIYGIIGACIILTSYLLINIIVTITGVECIKFFGFDCQ